MSDYGVTVRETPKGEWDVVDADRIPTLAIVSTLPTRISAEAWADRHRRWKIAEDRKADRLADDLMDN